MAYLVHVSCLSTTTVSQLFERQLQKVVIFTYPGLHFCLPRRRPCGNRAKRCMNEKTIFSACQTPRSMDPSIFNSFPVIRTATSASAKKSPFSRTAGHIFVSPGDAPAIITQYILHTWKDNSMLAKPLAACTYLSSIVFELYDA